MSLAMLAYPPPTKNGLEEFFYANFQHHQTITSAIFRTKGIVIPSTNIWPVRLNDFDAFLRNHQDWHNQIDSTLGIAGVDLQNVDFQNTEQRNAWIWLHRLSHTAWANALGGGV